MDRRGFLKSVGAVSCGYALSGPIGKPSRLSDLQLKEMWEKFGYPLISDRLRGIAKVQRKAILYHPMEYDCRVLKVLAEVDNVYGGMCFSAIVFPEHEIEDAMKRTKWYDPVLCHYITHKFAMAAETLAEFIRPGVS